MPEILTPRQRMLAAYTGQPTDFVPVAPEFWYYLPARLLDLSMIAFELEVPHWQALQQTFRHYACEGWGIAAPSVPPGLGGKATTTDRWSGEGQLERTTEVNVHGQVLRSRQVFDKFEPSWMIERCIKDFDRDWPAYERLSLVEPEALDWKPVRQALDAVGEDYLLEAYLGNAFVDYAGGQREGGLQQVILDLTDRPDEMSALQARYIDYMVRLTRAAFTHTTVRSVFIGSIWSSLSLLSPTLWRRWDKPVLQAVVQAAHACGGLVHHHFHGRCMGVLKELAELGLDCICPFERPPGGDVIDLPDVARALAGHTAFNGNVHTVETLIRGTPADVRREVLEILAAFRGSPRLVIGTGDQVGYETPEENIRAMIETARQYGKIA